MTKKLTKVEARILARLKRQGMMLVSATYQPTPTITKLLEKGLIRELPGLFKDAPQGYAPAE